MWFDVAKLIHEQVPDKSGNLLPTDLTSGSYEIRDLSNPGAGTLFEGKLVYDKTFGHVTYGCAVCCGFQSAYLQYDPLGVPFLGTSPDGALGDDSCGRTGVNISTYFYGNWSTASTSIATVDHYAKHTGVSSGDTTSFTSGQVNAAGAKTCPLRTYDLQGPTNVCPVPSSETTALYGTHQITEGSFVMTLNPSTNNYDAHYVTENNYAQGSNTCYWPGANMPQYPSVAGSTWVVGGNGSVHNHYGLDSIGFSSAGVNYIQTNAPAHGVPFPCVVTFYQEMAFECNATTFFDYAEDTPTQTIGSNTVKVCRAGVCTGTIPF